MRLANMPASGCAAAALTRLASQSGSGIASLLMVAMSGARADSKPLLLPAANPVFSESSITRTDGNASRTQTAVPSVEPLSTRMTSWRTFCCSTMAESDSLSRSRPFHVTTTTEACTGVMIRRDR